MDSDDDQLYRSDSGGASGESTEMTRVAAQLMQSPATQATSGGSDKKLTTAASNDLKLALPTALPAPATAPPLMPATLTSTSRAHHPLVSPPGAQPHQHLLDAATLAQLTPSAHKRMKPANLDAATAQQYSIAGLISPTHQHNLQLQQQHSLLQQLQVINWQVDTYELTHLATPATTATTTRAHAATIGCAQLAC
jgi:hypothetical protein